MWLTFLELNLTLSNAPHTADARENLSWLVSYNSETPYRCLSLILVQNTILYRYHSIYFVVLGSKPSDRDKLTSNYTPFLFFQDGLQASMAFLHLRPLHWSHSLAGPPSLVPCPLPLRQSQVPMSNGPHGLRMFCLSLPNGTVLVSNHRFNWQ